MSVIYLYGFVPDDVAPPPGGLLGVGDVEVERVDGPGFGAIIGRLESDDFRPDALERNCANVEWMAEQGLLHEQVVAWFVDHAAILPSRLLTLFSGEASVRAVLDREADRIRAELDRLAGLREWDLRLGHDPTKILQHLGEISEEVGRLDREIEAAGPGKRFLLEKKRKDMARTEGRDAARRMAHDLLDVLRPHARDVVTLDPPADATPTTLNAALLVDREGEAALAAELDGARERLEPLGLTIAVSGPWAPYRFMREHV
jgi:hypothetical protein